MYFLIKYGVLQTNLVDMQGVVTYCDCIITTLTFTFHLAPGGVKSAACHVYMKIAIDGQRWWPIV